MLLANKSYTINALIDTALTAGIKIMILTKKPRITMNILKYNQSSIFYYLCYILTIFIFRQKIHLEKGEKSCYSSHIGGNSFIFQNEMAISNMQNYIYRLRMSGIYKKTNGDAAK